MAFYSTDQDDDGLSISVDVIQWLRDQSGNFSDTDPDRFALIDGPGESPRRVYDKAVDLLRGLLGGNTGFTIGPFGLPVPPDTGPPPDMPGPEAVLQQIVDGINAAESKLNSQNFVIAAGSVEAKLELPVAAVTISLNIVPRPYS